MGPETKNALPSAQKFKDKLWRHAEHASYVKLWRPIAAIAVVLAAQVYDEEQPSVNPDTILNQQIPTVEQSTLYDNFDQEYPIVEKREFYGSFRIRNLPNKPKEDPAVISLEPTPSRITGYYCEQVPGYPIGDGGGYCEGTASGKPLQPGVAACGEKWPLGTKLLVEGYGVVNCLDRGYLAHDQVDIFFPTNKDWVESGKPDWAKVTIIEE